MQEKSLAIKNLGIGFFLCYSSCQDGSRGFNDPDAEFIVYDFKINVVAGKQIQDLSNVTDKNQGKRKRKEKEKQLRSDPDIRRLLNEV